jgi:hypothetical protein
MKRASSVGPLVLFFSSLASAHSEGHTAPATSGQSVEGAPPNVHLIDDRDPELPLVPRAPDLLGKHVLIGAAIGPTWALGKLASNVPAARALDLGVNLHADAGFGLSRTVAVGVWGSFSSYGDGSSCDACSGTAFGVGPFVRYHLSQGLRFAPWMLLGAGYRHVSYDALDGKNTFGGAEWLRLELGADYYVVSGLGLGPYASLGLSSYWSRPEATRRAAVSTELGAGLRVFFDLPGR